MHTRNFKEAMYQASLLYGIEFSDESEFEEIALVGYNNIGNKNVRYYHVKLDIDKETKSAELPCNVMHIEAITLPFEDYKHVDGVNSNGDIASMFTESYTESMKRFHNPIYSSGRLVNYNLVGRTLYFEHPYKYVDVLYEGEELDDDGLPMLNDSEVDALAVYVAYVKKYKAGVQTMNANLITVAQSLKADWLVKCDHARIPQHLDQNTMDTILNVKSTWDRKVYGYSFKPVMK